jgi:hypothetical protein
MIKNIYWLNEYAKQHHRSNVVELPLRIEGNDIKATLTQRFEDFVSLLREYDNYTKIPDPKSLNEMIDFIRQLKDCFLHLIQNDDKEYLWFDDILFAIDKKYNFFNCLKKNYNYKELYRIRIDNPNLHDEKDFYHCPIQKNHSNSRFGTPDNCLWYLGLSEKVCKYEARGKESSLATFLKKDTVNTTTFIDLTQDGLFSNGTSEFDMKSYLFFWLLICCYCVTEDISQDYLTYRFPQFLCKFIKKNYPEVSGIKYYTVRNEKLNPDETTFINLALFTKNYNEDGYDMNVCGDFIMTNCYQNVNTDLI